jgi:hypothetical protein
MAATRKEGGTGNGRGNGKGRGRPGAEHPAQGVRVHAEGQPGQRSADEVAEAAGAGHDQDRGVAVARRPAVAPIRKGKGTGKARDLNPQELLFLSFYLANGRKHIVAGDRVGINRRTAQRWITADYPVGRWLATEAEVSFQTVMAQRENLETLLVEALLAGLKSPDILAKEKAADLTARILGLDRGGSEHDLSPGTRAVFEAMGVALFAVAAGGEAPSVESDGIRAE